MTESYRRLIAEGRVFRDDFLNGYKYKWYRYSSLNADYLRWKNEVRELFKTFFGPESRYYRELTELEARCGKAAPAAVFSSYLETLKKADHEFSGRISAEKREALFTGVLEELLFKAEGLVKNGNYVPAAALAGAALEDVLRRLCGFNGLFCPENSTLDVINEILNKAGVYGAAEHEEVRLRIQLKKTAELCDMEKVNAFNAGELISWIRDFAARYLAGVKTARKA